MSYKVLVIGKESTFKKVKTIGQSYTQLSFVPLDPNEDMESALMQIQWNHMDAVLCTSPLPDRHPFRELVRGLPVFFVRYTSTALYASLFRCIYQQNLSSPLQFSVDFFGDEDIKDHLREEGILGQHLVLKVCENCYTSREELTKYHYQLWKSGSVQVVITSHPEVSDSLKALNVKTFLMSPSQQCIRSTLAGMVQKLKTKSRVPSSSAYRYEDEASLQELKKIGISGATIQKLYKLCLSLGSSRLTTAELARGFSITMRSARRILTTLEDHNVAQVIGEEQLHTRGRPRYVYHIDFNYFHSMQSLVPAFG
ncbi:hypothetical protein MUN89_18790 [Halobacillus salinarum]|uniref:Transcriptional regulator n=1 Tax=Halobacillus salinarum TaxID=2932257 RepID=A0ABY4EIV1_9BACI|nr:hypothetical protein [Halobacillus salinarum]UOQ43895.1 hypothetical protein MUN89_18790 [Halobacillus salinarum]